MTGRQIRVVALGVVRRDGDDCEELLVERHRDSESGEPFYRPLGGGVEFGEHSEEALRREFREELGVALENVSYLETYEDVFTHEGRTEHEVWRLYEADLADGWPYEDDEFTAYEPELDEEIECVWKPVTAFAGASGDGNETFYPEALLSAR